MTKDEVLIELERLGSEQTKKVLSKHGAREPFFGVKVTDMKKTLVRKIKQDYLLSLALYDTGISDAMYLAGLISEPNKMTREQLTRWAERAYWYMLSEYIVAPVTAESPYGWELALTWIESEHENIAAAGWSTLSNIVSITNDDRLNLGHIENLLRKAEEEIYNAPNRVRYTMNGFVISIGSYIPELHAMAMEVALNIGKVKVEIGGTSCKVPYAPEYIQKVVSKNKVGIKRKRAVC